MAFIVIVMAVALAMNAARADAAGHVTFIRRLAQSALAAALGSYSGYQVALQSRAIEHAPVEGMYATAGAVIGVLALRMSTLLAAIYRDFLKKRG